MAYCSRCTAIFIGLAIGLLIALFYEIKPSMAFLVLFIIALIPIGIDWTTQTIFGLRESTNTIRTVVGMPTGIMSGVSIGVIYDEIKKSKILHRIGELLLVH